MNFTEHIREGRLVYVTVWLPLLTLLPVLATLAWLSDDVIPLSAPTHSTTFRFAVQRPAPTDSTTPDSSGGADSQQAPAAPGSDAGDPLQEYLLGVIGEINRAKRYPRKEREEQIQGTVLVRLRLRRDGTATDVELLERSPHAGFNRAALAAVERAGPFAAMPDTVDRESVRLRLRLRFQLD